jgi:hypothetical protein
METGMTTSQTRQRAPWTVWLAAACIWFRAALILFIATGVFSAVFDPRLQDDTRIPGSLLGLALLVMIIGLVWIRVSVSLLRRRRWARETAIVFDAVTILLGFAFSMYADGSSGIGSVSVVFGVLSLVAVLMRRSVDWCTK